MNIKAVIGGSAVSIFLALAQVNVRFGLGSETDVAGTY